MKNSSFFQSIVKIELIILHYLDDLFSITITIINYFNYYLDYSGIIVILFLYPLKQTEIN